MSTKQTKLNIGQWVYWFREGDWFNGQIVEAGTTATVQSQLGKRYRVKASALLSEREYRDRVEADAPAAPASALALTFTGFQLRKIRIMDVDAEYQPEKPAEIELRPELVFKIEAGTDTASVGQLYVTLFDGTRYLATTPLQFSNI